MRPYFTRDRFGRPQFLAGLLLLAVSGTGVVAGSCRTELRLKELEGREAMRIGEGWKQWHGKGIAGAPFLEPAREEVEDPFQTEVSGFDTEHSPLIYLVTAGPLLIWPHDFDAESSTVLEMASPPAISRLRRLSWRFVVVRRAQALRQYRRICCSDVLLLFTIADSGQCRVAHRT